MKKLAVFILVYNEEKHIERCVDSLRFLNCDIYIIDSGSYDDTLDICESLNLNVVSNDFINHAQQTNFAIDYLSGKYEWAFRIDADEIIDEELSKSILESISGDDVDGLKVPRTMFFLEKKIRFGGLFPIYITRVFKITKSRCLQRWMDEHIAVQGKTKKISGNLYDINLNSLSWWISKHNSYSSKEAFEQIANGFCDKTESPNSSLKKLYGFFPWYLRSFMYLFYRLVFRLGFLDGARGLAFHILQGFWYRYLVDLKVREIHSHSQKNSCSLKESAFILLDNVNFDSEK